MNAKRQLADVQRLVRQLEGSLTGAQQDLAQKIRRNLDVLKRAVNKLERKYRDSRDD